MYKLEIIKYPNYDKVIKSIYLDYIPRKGETLVMDDIWFEIMDVYYIWDSLDPTRIQLVLRDA